jgi:hypothetical protein
MKMAVLGFVTLLAWLPDGSLVMSASAQAQSPAASAAAPATNPPTGPSAETLKKAKQVGMRPEVEKNGTTLYCWEDATTGTRFKTKKCIDEGQLDAVIEQRQLARDQTKKALGCGLVCGSTK